MSEISRRAVLQAGAVASAAALARAVPESVTPPPRRSSGQSIRLVHATDMHVQPELRAADGWRAMLGQLHDLSPRADLLVTGGDLIMDASRASANRTRTQWDLFNSVLSEAKPRDLPAYHVIGNHDIFGRHMAESGATGSEPDFGRGWFLRLFGYPNTYQAIKLANWTLIMLDSFELLETGSYRARLDQEQFAWLESTLHDIPAGEHAVVISHVPIISSIVLTERQATVGPDGFDIQAKRMHIDSRAIEQLFQRTDKVRLCLSGHLHQLDRVDYNRVSYICSGAVSGEKWLGPRYQTPEGYGVVDLHPDGRFDYRYATLGWQA